MTSLPLSYCANVHPGDTWDEAVSNLRRFAFEVRRKRCQRLGVGLWMSARALFEQTDLPSAAQTLAHELAREEIVVYTMNAFPFGNFHADRVKENVYLPNWTSPERVAYTLRTAELLSLLLPEGVEGSISTLPLAFQGHHPSSETTRRYHAGLLSAVRGLAEIERRTGQTIRLALEPEPACVLERTDQAIGFFRDLWQATEGSADEQIVRRHLGLCYDVCHQAVEFEFIAASLNELASAGVPVVKIQLSSAIELSDPYDEDARRQLATYAEPRYLHQTYAESYSGRILRRTDLTAEEALDPSAEWLDVKRWRIHFHVPVHQSTVGKLSTTRTELHEAIRTAKKLFPSAHLEVETYTWDVLPGESLNLVDGIVQELNSIDDALWSHESKTS